MDDVLAKICADTAIEVGKRKLRVSVDTLRAKAEKLPNYVRGGIDKDYVQNTAFGAAATEPARKAAGAATADLKANKPYFVGPLKDNNGNVVLAAGASIDNYDVKLEQTNYLVEGVIGSIT